MLLCQPFRLWVTVVNYKLAAAAAVTACRAAEGPSSTRCCPSSRTTAEEALHWQTVRRGWCCCCCGHGNVRRELCCAVLCARSGVRVHLPAPASQPATDSLDGACQLRLAHGCVYGLVAGHSKGAQLLAVDGGKLRQVYHDPAQCCCRMRAPVCLQHSQDEALLLEGPYCRAPAVSTRRLQQQQQWTGEG